MTPNVLMPSDRKFGWTFAVLFLLVGAFYHPWMIAVGAVLAVITMTRAHWLAPFKGAWMRFGELLNRVVSPVVMGVIYFTVFTPVAIVMRLAKRDALERSYDAAAPTYWKRRDPPGPADDSFKNLF
jgi:Saxitoxin biosynthesis operon protein SxtJ